MIEFAPSILNADLSRLGEEVGKVAERADWLHLDVMDGHFVPNLTFGPMLAKALVQCGRLPVEAHLMVWQPEKMVPWFVEAGCRRIIIHPEATPHIHRAIDQIKRAGVEAGAALNPGTPLTALAHVWEDLDLVLVMTVDPGYGGQHLIPATIPKIAEARGIIAQRGLRCRLEVDGGINAETLRQMVEAGADTLVVGSYLFAGPDPEAALAQLRLLAENRANGGD